MYKLELDKNEVDIILLLFGFLFSAFGENIEENEDNFNLMLDAMKCSFKIAEQLDKQNFDFN